MLVTSTNFSNSGAAPEKKAPPPANNNGLSALAISPIALSISPEVATGLVRSSALEGVGIESSSTSS